MVVLANKHHWGAPIHLQRPEMVGARTFFSHSLPVTIVKKVRFYLLIFRMYVICRTCLFADIPSNM